MTPTNIRFTDDQLSFLAAMDGDTKTPIGEKVRRLVDEGRELREGLGDYLVAINATTRLAAYPRQCIRAREYALGRRSEMVARAFESIPETMAYLISSACEPSDGEQLSLAELEAGLADRLLDIVETLLHQSATDFSSCYESRLIRERIQPRLIALSRLAGLLQPHATTGEQS